MPRSTRSTNSSSFSHAMNEETQDVGQEALETSQPTYDYDPGSYTHRQSVAVSVNDSRRLRSARASQADLRNRLPLRIHIDESSGLLANNDGPTRNYISEPSSAFAPRLSRRNSAAGSLRQSMHLRRSGSLGARLASAFSPNWSRHDPGPAESKSSIFADERVWYDQFTSTDWVHDSIADNFRVRDLRARRDFWGRMYARFDGAQGWLVVAIVGCLTACTAYFVDITETAIFDVKEGFCKERWLLSRAKCCLVQDDCPSWVTWGESLELAGLQRTSVDLLAFVAFVVLFSAAACLLTLVTKTVVPSAISLSTLDENLGADNKKLEKPAGSHANNHELSPSEFPSHIPKSGAMIYYPAAGSGVAEVKVINSGFVIHGYLGVQTLIIKTLGLILSIASGLSLGKEGPFVHMAACIGNITCRMFSKYNYNDGKRREVLSASAASGVAVAFGAPIAGTLFSLEEVSYYFPPKTLFRTFFCCIAAAVSLKFLNPYGTGKIVIFEVRYVSDWHSYELIAFVLLGILGGFLGAVFIKASRLWARTFRRIPTIKRWPLFEVVLVALATGFGSFWIRYTRLPVTELLYELASPCRPDEMSGLCPHNVAEVKVVIRRLCIAFVIKSFLTTITFGIKVPAGIYVPSMVVGGLLGRIVGHMAQYLVFRYPNAAVFAQCSQIGGTESCVTPGVYALVAAGATMCGVTRLSVTLAVILFELTGSLDHVLPFSLAVLVAKWTADALEPLSIYDLLTEMNDYPFLDNKVRPIFTSQLGDVIPSKIRPERVIDISLSVLVPATNLRQKLEYLHDVGEIDGGIPILRYGVLVGLIPAPDLEFGLDKLDDEDNAVCMMASNPPNHSSSIGVTDQTLDFTTYTDPAPVALDYHSPMDLVFQCFTKLGLRYICVTRDGKYAGLVHKKAFVKYIRELEEAERI
ncbi:hypothetical protein MMC25_008363 [Agyrium rufum]|nr:hypothetical protein [Agyrium rufum]